MNTIENDYALITYLKIQHKKHHYVFKLLENLYLCNIPKLSAYHPLLFDSVWNHIEDRIISCMFNNKQTNNIVINGSSNASKQIFNTQLLSFILSKLHPQNNQISTQIACIPTLIDALCCIQSHIYHYDPQCNLWLKIAYRNHNNQNILVGAHMDLIGVNNNIFQDVSSLQHIPIICMLKAYFIKTPSMYLSSLPFNHKKISTLPSKDGFKQFVEFQKALTLLNFTEERQQEIYDLFIALAHLHMIEYYHDAEDKMQYHTFAASSLLGISADSLRKVLFSTTNKTKCIQRHTVNGIIRHLYINTIKSIVEHINVMIAPSVDIHSNPSMKILGIFYIRGTEYEKVGGHNNDIGFLCSNYVQEILNNNIMNRYVHRLNNQLYKEGIVLKQNIAKSGNSLLSFVSNIPSLIGSSHSISTILDITSNNLHIGENTMNHKKITSDFVWLLNDKLKSKLKVNKDTKSFVINHCFGDVQYNASEFSQRNRYYVDADIIELLSSSKNLLVRHINAYDKKLVECKQNSFMNDFIAQSTDIMERITMNNDIFVIYCFEPNSKVDASLDRLNEIQFDYKHVWNQLVCYPALFDVYYLSLHSYPYTLSISYLYYKSKPLFENSDYFGYLADHPILMITALLTTFHFLQTNDYKVGTTNIFFRNMDKLIAVKNINLRSISREMKQKLEDWQAHQKLVAAKGILRVSKMFSKMIDDLREESKIHHIVQQMILLSKFQFKCISLQQRMRLRSSIRLRNKWHRINTEDRNSNKEPSATAHILNDKWQNVSNEMDSLYAEATKILSHRPRTFSMLDKHHPYLHINKLELFGDAVVTLTSPITIHKRSDKTWVDYVKEQNIKPQEYMYKKYPRFTTIDDKETIVVSPIDQHLRQKKKIIKPKSPAIINTSNESFIESLDSVMKHIVSEHKEKGKTMMEITRETSMQKISERKSKMPKSKRKTKQAMTADILSQIKHENQRVSTMIRTTKSFKTELQQNGVRPSMMTQVESAANIHSDNEEIEKSFRALSTRLSVMELNESENGSETEVSLKEVKNETQVLLPITEDGSETEVSLKVDTKELNKGEMILHCDDGLTKKIVMLYIDDSGLNIIIDQDVYSLLSVASVSLEADDKFTIHIQDTSNNETKHIVLEAANPKERDLWIHHIILMAKKSRGLRNNTLNK